MNKTKLVAENAKDWGLMKVDSKRSCRNIFEYAYHNIEKVH